MSPATCLLCGVGGGSPQPPGPGAAATPGRAEILPEPSLPKRLPSVGRLFGHLCISLFSVLCSALALLLCFGGPRLSWTSEGRKCLWICPLAAQIHSHSLGSYSPAQESRASAWSMELEAWVGCSSPQGAPILTQKGQRSHQLHGVCGPSCASLLQPA